MDCWAYLRLFLMSLKNLLAWVSGEEKPIFYMGSLLATVPGFECVLQVCTLHLLPQNIRTFKLNFTQKVISDWKEVVTGPLLVLLILFHNCLTEAYGILPHPVRWISRKFRTDKGVVLHTAHN